MGRKGTHIYDSDSTKDYLATITNRLECELAYWLSPEHVFEGSWWLAKVFTVLEIMLLFEQRDFGSSVYIHSVSAVQRWRTVVFNIWDGDWKDNDERYFYSDPEYRIQHRHVIVKIFDRLESIALFWTSIGSSTPQPELTPLSDEYPLPYFSIWRFTTQDNEEIYNLDSFTRDLIEYLVRDIVYWLSTERRDDAVDREEVWVSVDLLGFLCETYKQKPGPDKQIVRTWRSTMTQVWKDYDGGNIRHWDDPDSLYQNIMHAFDRLESVAQKYPAFEW